MNFKGYTLSYRSKWNHPAFSSLLDAAIWGWMIDSAYYEDGIKNVNGTIINLKRGQFFTSLRFISDGFEVSNNKVRKLFNILESQKMIETQKTHLGTIVTVCNYNDYQVSEKHKNTPTNTPKVTPRGTPTDTPKVTNKDKDNKVNEVNEEISRAYNLYNELAEKAGLPKAQVLTDTRKRKIKNRLKDCGGIDGWKIALEKVEESDFCTGKTKDWKASLDFILQKSSFIKIMEGTYDSTEPKSKGGADEELAEYLEGIRSGEIK